MTVLLLGGTAEARALARALVEAGRPVLSSLAGRVSDPTLPAGDVRIGGFGGAAGLRRFLEETRPGAVVDATHPFAVRISAHAALAAAEAGVPLLRLQRPGWGGHPRAGEWTWVAGPADVVEVPTRRPFLTTGRQSLPAFLPWADRAVLVRLVEPPAEPLPPAWRPVLSRGPYRYDDERRLMLGHDVDLLVTKDSGGSWTAAKLDAAGDLGIPVVVLSRPAPEPGVETVATVAEVLGWLDANR